jgi:hypothetical protein
MESCASEILDVMQQPAKIFRQRRGLLCRQWSAHLGAMVALATIAAIAWGTHKAQNRGHVDVMLLYVGAEDCAPCRIWRNREGAAFLASAESARITYREVKSPHLEDVLKDENWPNDIRPFRDGVRRTDGVPLWLVVAGHEVVERQFGATAWERRVLPKIRSYLR